jgi:dihydroorotate dehydrogenase
MRVRLGPTLPIIGAGGISSVADAREMFDAGATLVQVYTGFIYRGPILVHELSRL